LIGKEPTPSIHSEKVYTWDEEDGTNLSVNKKSWHRCVECEKAFNCTTWDDKRGMCSCINRLGENILFSVDDSAFAPVDGNKRNMIFYYFCSDICDNKFTDENVEEEI